MHVGVLLHFHAISFQKLQGSQWSYAEREARRHAQAFPADNQGAGGFLAFQRHRQKVRASPLPCSPFPEQTPPALPSREGKQRSDMLPAHNHCSYSMRTHTFALFSLRRAAVLAA